MQQANICGQVAASAADGTPIKMKRGPVLPSTSWWNPTATSDVAYCRVNWSHQAPAWILVKNLNNRIVFVPITCSGLCELYENFVNFRPRHLKKMAVYCMKWAYKIKSSFKKKKDGQHLSETSSSDLSPPKIYRVRSVWLVIFQLSQSFSLGSDIFY